MKMMGREPGGGQECGLVAAGIKPDSLPGWCLKCRGFCPRVCYGIASLQHSQEVGEDQDISLLGMRHQVEVP